MQRKMRRLIAASLTITALATAPCLAEERLGKGEVEAIAAEAFVYGFPMVMNDGVVYVQR